MVKIKKCIVLFQAFSDMKRESLQKKVEKLITFGLRGVFQKQYTFKLGVEIKRKVSNYIFTVVDETGLETDIMNAHGGGLVVTIAFLLQVLLLVVVKPNRRRFMILDEPFGMLSDMYRENMSNLVKVLSEKLKIQFLMITHSREFESHADRIYQFSLKDGKTICRERSKELELDTRTDEEMVS